MKKFGKGPILCSRKITRTDPNIPAESHSKVNDNPAGIRKNISCVYRINGHMMTHGNMQTYESKNISCMSNQLSYCDTWTYESKNIRCV